MKIKLPKIKKKTGKNRKIKLILIVFVIVLLPVSYVTYNHINVLRKQISNLTSENDISSQELEKIRNDFETLKNEDQYLRNESLQEEITNINSTYSKAVAVYEDLLKLKEKTKELDGDYDELYAQALSLLADKNYEEAEKVLADLNAKITEETDKITAAYKIPQSVTVSNTPPGSGYSRQSVSTDVGTFMVSMIAADIGSTRTIVDTASDSDCSNDCPVLPLADYVSRNGAFAGVNGSYFCPATYPSCVGKTNSFDLLAMNFKKTYFNSGNNVYSNNPAVIFGDGYIRFVNSASEWGRDTSPNGVLSNYPMLVFNKEVKFGGDDDPKKGSKGNRSFVANKGNTVYIGVVHSATVAESARVMQALGMENAMNLDDGGSTALWYGGYKVGPGRNLPNVILLVRK